MNKLFNIFALCILVLILVACSSSTMEAESTTEASADSTAAPSSALKLAKRPVSERITLSRKQLQSSVPAVTDTAADHALRIATYILNSTEFQDSVRERQFDYQNICDGCSPNHKKHQPPLMGKQILDSLLRQPNAALLLTVKEYGRKPKGNKCYGLGATCPNSAHITSYYQNINCDMGGDFPFAYAYAVHLCHEYTHEVGYCHTYTEGDAAEAVGWIAYHYMKQWYDTGVRIP